jgi:hypothetical protein
MASGGTYSLKDASDAHSFPAPVIVWREQILGGGLDGRPGLNAYRLLVWRWTGLDADDMGNLVGFQTRRQAGTTTWLEIETDPYDETCDDVSYRTVVYDDAVIKNITRERGYPNWQNVTATFEVLVA